MAAPLSLEQMMRCLHTLRGGWTVKSQHLILSWMAKTSPTCDLETIHFTDSNPAATLPSNKTCPLLNAALVVLTNNLHPFVPHTLPINLYLGRLQNCELPLSKLGFQRFNVSTPDVGSHSFFSRLLFKICSFSFVVSTPVATRDMLAFGTFHLAPKPVVKNCCPLDSCSVLRRM